MGLRIREHRTTRVLLNFQGLAELQGAAKFHNLLNDYTSHRYVSNIWEEMRAFWIFMLFNQEVRTLEAKRDEDRSKGKKVSSVKLGRNNDEGNLSEEHHDQDDEGFDATVTPDFERKSDETEALERKSDETEQVNIEEEKDASDVKSGDTEELDLETIQSPSSPIHQTQEEEPKEQFKDDELLADIILNRPRGLSIPGPMQSQPQQPTQSLETKNDEEVAKKIQAEWDAEEERKRLEALKKPKTILKKPTSLVQERNQMMSFLKGQGYKNLQKFKVSTMKEIV
ncbi:hypothetical protein Tco_0088880 [Tanacetum coccineum]